MSEANLPPDSRGTSLLALEADQPLLFSHLEGFVQEDVQGYEKRHHDFTAARLFSQRPEVYRGIVVLLGAGAGVRAVARALQVSPNTVVTVRERECAAVDTLKRNTVTDLQAFIGLCAERFREEAYEIDIDKLAIPFGIAVEKMQLLSGGATARVEHVVAEPPIDRFNEYVRNLPSADAHTVPAMGVEAGKSFAKGDGATRGS